MKSLITLIIVSLSIISTSSYSQQGKKRLSVSGSPQDEAYCGMLGDNRIPDEKCLRPSLKDHQTILNTSYDIKLSFVIRSTDHPSVCKTANYAQPILQYLNNKKIRGRLDFVNGECIYNFPIKNKQELCSADAIRILQRKGAEITALDSTKAGNINYRNTYLIDECK